MEARGEIRGGRFVGGFAGEQFALPEAVQAAREVRRAPLDGERVLLSAVDPLNLTGIVTPGPRIPAIAGNLVGWIDGVPEPEPRPGPLGPRRLPEAEIWAEQGGAAEGEPADAGMAGPA
jgi:hypothetical protein